MKDTVLWTLLGLLVLAAMIALIVYTWARVGSYFDRRLSDSEEDVQADVERYGADAGGIRSELLSPEERQDVLDARRQRRQGEATPPSGPVPPTAPPPDDGH